jgi:PAS domain S-box-containing protein
LTVVVRDVSDRKRAEAQLRKAQEELEQRVTQRTQQLSAINAELRAEVAERQRAEEALRRSEARLQEAQRIASLGSWEMDLINGQLEWSEEVFRIFEVDSSAFQPSYERFLTAVHPDDRALVEQTYAQALKNRWHYEIVHRLCLPDGRIKHVSARGETHYGDDGRPLRSLGTLQDVTDRVRATSVLQERERQLALINETLEQRVQERTNDIVRERNFTEAILNTAGALVCVLDRDGRIVRFNRACEVTTGYSATEVTGKSVFGLFFASKALADFRQVLAQLIHGGVSSIHEIPWLTKSTERRLISWTNSVIRDAAGEVAFVIATGIDVTERKHAEQEMLRAKESAERANRAKSEFLSRMSHELRTPLNAILGFSQILQMDLLSPSQSANVAEITKAARMLLSLINELLDLATIESGRLPITIKPTALGSVLKDAITLVKPLCCAAEITLEDQTQGADASWVLADATRTQQILVNLLSNAAKYGRRGGYVRVRCEAHPPAWLRISVTDDGPGLSEEQQGQLFAPFERLGAEHSGIEGTGIGLALSRKLAELMGGELGVDSARSRGSTFWLQLPQVAMPEASPVSITAARQGAVEVSAARVLYIEDNPANLRFMEELMKKFDHLELLTANSGEQGLAMASREHPEVILMDIHLPGRDGYSLQAQLRANPATRDIPVIAVSADAMLDDIKRGLDAGFFRYLTKPVEVPALLDAVEAALRVRR